MTNHRELLGKLLHKKHVLVGHGGFALDLFLILQEGK